MSQWKYMGVSSKAQCNKVFKIVPEVLSIKAEAEDRGVEKMFYLNSREKLAEDTNLIRDN